MKKADLDCNKKLFYSKNKYIAKIEKKKHQYFRPFNYKSMTMTGSKRSSDGTKKKMSKKIKLYLNLLKKRWLVMFLMTRVINRYKKMTIFILMKPIATFRDFCL